MNTKLKRAQNTKKTRKDLWMGKWGAKGLMDSNPGYYKSLKENFYEYPNPSYSQIEIDLKRTFTSQKEHMVPGREDQMRSILRAYWKRNPTIGYCQGCNFIVAVLLQHLDEEETFWVLCQIIEFLLPLDYYTVMTGAMVDQRCLELLLNERLKKVSKHLKKIEFDCRIHLFQWFVCLFANALPFNIVTNIWDEFFNRGIEVIFQYGLGIFELLQKEILATKDMGMMFELFRSIPETITDWKKLSAAAKKHKINYEVIKAKRRYLRPIVTQEFEEQHRKKDNDISLRNSIGAIKVKFLNKFPLFNGLMKQWGQGEINKGAIENYEEEIVNCHECNVKWPICLYDFLYKERLRDHFAYRTQNINIEEDYFGDGKGSNIKAKTDSEATFPMSNLDYDDLLIERNGHIWEYDNLEGKFKALFRNQINEFFLSVVHLSSDDPFDELIDNNDKIRGFIEICSELVDRHNLKWTYDSRKAIYLKPGEKHEPTFLDEINKLEDIDSDEECSQKQSRKLSK